MQLLKFLRPENPVLNFLSFFTSPAPLSCKPLSYPKKARGYGFLSAFSKYRTIGQSLLRNSNFHYSCSPTLCALTLLYGQSLSEYSELLKFKNNLRKMQGSSFMKNVCVFELQYCLQINAFTGGTMFVILLHAYFTRRVEWPSGPASSISFTEVKHGCVPSETGWATFWMNDQNCSRRRPSEGTLN